MSGEKIILFAALVMACSGLTCPGYKCVSFSGTCYTANSNNTVTVSYCPSGQSCSTSTGICSNTTTPSYANLAAGLACNATSICRYNCTNGVCLGRAQGSACNYDADCDTTSYCTGINGNNGTCVALLAVGKACTATDECIQGSECFNGLCTNYYSIPSGNALPGGCPSSYISNMCQSGQCYGGANAMCVEAFKSTKSVPHSCSTDGDCPAKNNNMTINGSCECAYTKDENKAYCAIQMGDSYGQKLLSKAKSWYTSSAIKNCNVAAQMNLCMQKQWESSSYFDYLYYSYMVGYQNKINDAEHCTLSVMAAEYLYLHEQVHDGSSVLAFLLPLGLIYLA